MLFPIAIGTRGFAMGLISEFKTFINRGNVIDLAVGVIIGGAFATITKSLTDDLIMPVVGYVFGGADFSRYFIRLGRSEEHTSELQSLMRISYAVLCLKKKKTNKIHLRSSVLIHDTQ